MTVAKTRSQQPVFAYATTRPVVRHAEAFSVGRSRGIICADYSDAQGWAH